MRLRYNDFIALLTKAIQEQQEIIDAQKSEINLLNSELIVSKRERKLFDSRLEQLEIAIKINQQ